MLMPWLHASPGHLEPWYWKMSQKPQTKYQNIKCMDQKHLNLKVIPLNIYYERLLIIKNMRCFYAMTQLADACAWLDLVERLSYYHIGITGMQNILTISMFNPYNAMLSLSIATQLVVQLFLFVFVFVLNKTPPQESCIQNFNMNRSWNSPCQWYLTYHGIRAGSGFLKYLPDCYLSMVT